MTRRRFAFIALVLLPLLAAPSVVTAADGDMVGKVSRLQGAAVAMQDALPRPLKAGDAVLLGDVISTGKGARLEMTMADDAVMTLGAKTIFVVIDYVAQGAEPNAAMRLLEGAFSAVSGKMMASADASFTVETEVATIGIRGTTFWGGMLKDTFEVALLDGKGIVVENKAGRVVIEKPGQGTGIGAADRVPTRPKTWSPVKINEAVATVTFN